MKNFMNFKYCRSLSSHMHTHKKGIKKSFMHRTYVSSSTWKKLVLY